MKLRLPAVFLVTVLAARELPAATRVEFTVKVDPTAPALNVWLTYLLGRLSYVTQHPSEYPAHGHGLVIPTLPEEFTGRRTAVEAYQEMLHAGKITRDPYWDDVVKVSQAGFLLEYVWTYFHKPAWNAVKPPKKLAQFEQWRKANLAAHRPATYGGLAYGSP